MESRWVWGGLEGLKDFGWRDLRWRDVDNMGWNVWTGCVWEWFSDGCLSGMGDCIGVVSFVDSLSLMELGSGYVISTCCVRTYVHNKYFLFVRFCITSFLLSVISVESLLLFSFMYACRTRLYILYIVWCSLLSSWMLYDYSSIYNFHSDPVELNGVASAFTSSLDSIQR